MADYRLLGIFTGDRAAVVTRQHTEQIKAVAEPRLTENEYGSGGLPFFVLKYGAFGERGYKRGYREGLHFSRERGYKRGYIFQKNGGGILGENAL